VKGADEAIAEILLLSREVNVAENGSAIADGTVATANTPHTGRKHHRLKRETHIPSS
jgi:hypothetical protein